MCIVYVTDDGNYYGYGIDGYLFRWTKRFGFEDAVIVPWIGF